MPALWAASSAASTGIDDVQRVLGGQSTLLAQQLPEGAPLDVLHGEIDRAVVIALVIHGHDRGMREPGGRACLGDEPDDELVVGGKIGMHDLERHDSVQSGVHRPVNRGHATARHDRLHLVATVEKTTDQRRGDVRSTWECTEAISQPPVPAPE